MNAILNKDDYREFTQRVDLAVSKGQEVPHIVEMISANQYRVTFCLLYTSPSPRD